MKSEFEQQRIESMLALGCCACKVEADRFSSWPSASPECHHMLSGGRRMGHLFTIPLCAGHHRGDWTPEQKVYWRAQGIQYMPSIAGGRKSFVFHYGTERWFWEKTQEQLGLPIDWPESKVVARTVPKS